MRSNENKSSGKEANQDKALFLKEAKRILGLLPPHWRSLSLGLTALAVAAAINLSFPFLIRIILNQDLRLMSKDQFALITLALIGLFAVQSFFFYLRHFCFHAVGYRIVSDLRNKLFSSLLDKDVSFFDRAKTGDLLSRLTADTEVVQRALTVNISVALRYIVQVIGGTALMFVISSSLTLVIIVLIPVITIASAWWGKRLSRYSQKLQETLGDANTTADEALNNIRSVKIFSGTGFEANKYAKRIRTYCETGLARTRIAAIFASSMVFIIHSAIAVLIWFGAVLVMETALTVGDLTAFLLYCIIVAMSFGFLVRVWDEFTLGLGASARIFEIIDHKTDIVTVAAPRMLPEHQTAKLRFNEVTFSYPARPELSALEEVSFEIGEGETVALVGPSGSGKSTVAKLIPRFYDPEKGEISYLGVPIKELDVEELRKCISVVSQPPEIFSVSIADNIAYGKRGATKDEVIEAAKMAQLDEFIATLPDSFDTLVGDKGVRLSGGERQRVAIARAILKNPKFLILDEATSALDSKNEFLVQQALERLMKNRTTLIIAHRLSTVKHADKVIVLERGRIAQYGTHSSLNSAPGLYQNLVEHQLLH